MKRQIRFQGNARVFFLDSYLSFRIFKLDLDFDLRFY